MYGFNDSLVYKQPKRSLIHGLVSILSFKQEILKRIDGLVESKEESKIPPPGTRVLIADTDKLSQRDKATVPIWLASRDKFSKREATIKDYRDGFYLLDIDDGEHVWPGRWLTKIN